MDGWAKVKVKDPLIRVEGQTDCLDWWMDGWAKVKARLRTTKRSYNPIMFTQICAQTLFPLTNLL